MYIRFKVGKHFKHVLNYVQIENKKLLYSSRIIEPRTEKPTTELIDNINKTEIENRKTIQ